MVQAIIHFHRLGTTTALCVHKCTFSSVCICQLVYIGNHTHLSPNREIIVLTIVKIGQGEAESNFNYCVYNCSLIGQEYVISY